VPTSKLHRFEWIGLLVKLRTLDGRKLYLQEANPRGTSSTNPWPNVREIKQDLYEWASLGNRPLGLEIGPSLFQKSRSTTEDIHTAFFIGKLRPLNVTFAKGFRTPFADAILEACARRNSCHPDYNGEKSRKEASPFSVYN